MSAPARWPPRLGRYRRELEKQVEESKTRRSEEDMNDTEFRLNSDLVKKLEADKKLVSVLVGCSSRTSRRTAHSHAHRQTTEILLLLPQCMVMSNEWREEAG